MDAIRKFRGDPGIGMTELAVAIVLLGIVLVGLFPLMVDSIRLAQNNSQVGQANRAVETNIDRSRSVSLGGTCKTVGGVSGFTGTTSSRSLFESAAGLDGIVSFSCLGNPDGLVTVRVDVWRSGDPSKKPISTATTKVFAP